MLRTLLCDENNEFLVVEDFSIISDIVATENRQLWLDMERPTEEEFRLVQEEFQLHPLAMDDATKRHQRPKVDEYANFYFVVFYVIDALEGLKPEESQGRLGLKGTRFHGPEALGKGEGAEPQDEKNKPQPVLTSDIVLHEISMFLGKNYLITVHDAPVAEFNEVARRWFRNSKAIKEEIKAASAIQGARRLTDQEASALEPRAGDDPAALAKQATNGGSAGPLAGPRTDGGQGATASVPKPRIASLVAPPQPDGVAEADKEKTEQHNDIGVLLYSLLDTIVDGYFPLVDDIADRVEDLEEEIFRQFNQRALESVFSLKKDLLALRKVLAPERDVLNILTRRDLPLFDEHTVVYFQDVYDHIVRVTDSIDTYRDLLSSALDSFLSMQSNRLNITVQTLTSVSIILMTIATFTGWYGMNFQNMPELQMGYPYLAGAVFLIVAAEVVFFKRRRWF